ncbi:MAG: beta-ketoacyl synthase [Planctomycetaceae bacterium]
MKAGFKATRAVVTGVGVISPVGIGNDDFWRNLMAGKSGIGYLRAFPNADLPIKLAAEVADFDPTLYVRHKKFVKVMSRDIQLGVAAASLSMKDAGLAQGAIDPERLGVVYGAGRISSSPTELAQAVRQCSTSGNEFDYSQFGEQCLDDISPLWLLRQLPNMPACHVSIEFDARGPNNTITSRESSALLALSEAIGVIRRGAADCMIVGACSSNIHPVDITKLSLFDSLSRRDADPERACRPFDFERDGAIVGEGAAAFIIESYDHAVRRGAEIYAEVVGVGAGCDGSGFENAGTGLVRAMSSALRQSGLEPSQLGHINAHGISTQQDDLVEARAYHRALGSSATRIPVTALKSYFGNFDAGSGAVELAASLLSLKHGSLPRTLNYETPDPRCRINVVHDEPIHPQFPTALSVNRTAMGQSAACVVRAV